jgi:hypothetical protein
MRRIFALMTVAVFMFGMATLGFAGVEKCAKCHKGEKTIDKIVEKKGIATADDLKKALREGPKAGMHKISSDDDIKASIEELKLK